MGFFVYSLNALVIHWSFLLIIFKIIYEKIYHRNSIFRSLFWANNLNPKFWKSDHIVLSKEEKIENIVVGEEVVLGYQDSIEHTVIGKIIAVNDKEIKIKQTDNKKISIINLKDITFIEIEIIHSGCYNGALLGGLLSGGYIAMIGD